MNGAKCKVFTADCNRPCSSKAPCQTNSISAAMMKFERQTHQLKLGLNITNIALDERQSISRLSSSATLVFSFSLILPDPRLWFSTFFLFSSTEKVKVVLSEACKWCWNSKHKISRGCFTVLVFGLCGELVPLPLQWLLLSVVERCKEPFLLNTQ